MKPQAAFKTTPRFVEALRARRANFLRMLGGGIGIITSHVVPKAFDRFGYRAGSHFYYLTGLPESDAIAVFVPNHPKEKAVLFLRERNPVTELWNGPMVGVDGAVSELGFDAAYPLSRLREKLIELMPFADSIYWNNDPREYEHQQLNDIIATSPLRQSGGSIFIDVAHLIGELRLFKDEIEIEELQMANDIASRAHEEAMKRAAPGLYEYQVQATLEAAMLERGSLRRGYPSIVAAGSNACCLHYNISSSPLERDDLLLIDAGTESNGYTSDITRTCPVSGKFSAEQKAVYQAVLDVQKNIIDMVKPGIRFQQLNERAIELLSEAIVSLGLLKNVKVNEVIDKKLYRDFYAHGVSHWLGLDVHDVGRYKIKNQDRLLEPGMCFTVEPGLYIQPENTNVEERWRGIGVRIEDNVCVTATGVYNFTTCVKEVADIENLLAKTKQ